MRRNPSRPRRRPLLVGLVALGLLAAACEDVDDSLVTPATTTIPTTDPPLTTQPSASTTAPPTTAAAAGGEDGVLRIASLLPATGSLAAFGPPLIEAVELAVIDINAAGGVLGQPVELLAADSGSDADVAATEVGALLDGGADVVIGPVVGGVTRRVFDTVISRPALSCLPSTTAADIGVRDSPFAIRTAPSDDLQALALAELAAGDEPASVTLLAPEDERGLRFASGIAAELTTLEIELAGEVVYDPESEDLSDTVQAVVDAGGDVVAVLGAIDEAPLVADLVAAGIDGGSILVTDALAGPQLGERASEEDPGVVEGVRGTVPTDLAPQGAEFFLPAFVDFAGNIDTFFAAQAYDCVAVVALAAVSVSSTDPATLTGALVDVTVGGTPCDTIAECVTLLGAGEDIDYVGASGVDLDDAGEATSAVYDVFTFDADGTQQPLTQLGVGPAAAALAAAEAEGDAEEGDGEEGDGEDPADPADGDEDPDATDEDEGT
ncbi:MAG: ABC transporter substrate-binding protein [Actinomycetota bacterium]